MARARSPAPAPAMGSTTGSGPASDYGSLPTEAVHPRAARLDTLPAEAVVRLMLTEEVKSVQAAAARADVIGRAAELVAKRLAAGGRLVYAGAGTSGRLGTLDA